MNNLPTIRTSFSLKDMAYFVMQVKVEFKGHQIKYFAEINANPILCQVAKLYLLWCKRYDRVQKQVKTQCNNFGENGKATRNTHTKYERSTSGGLKDMGKFKVFFHRQTDGQTQIT